MILVSARWGRFDAYDKIKAELLTYALSGLGKRLIETLKPAVNRLTVAQRLQETTEMRWILDAAGYIPLTGLIDLTETLDRVERGGILDPGSLTEIADFLRLCRKLKGFMARYRELAPLVCGYADCLTTSTELEELIELSIDNGQVSNDASSRLAKIRGQIETLESRIRDRVHSYLTSPAYREYLQEAIVTMKEGRYCLAVKASCRNKLEGTVMGSSGSGQTVFVEPAPVRKLANDLAARLTRRLHGPSTDWRSVFPGTVTACGLPNVWVCAGKRWKRLGKYWEPSIWTEKGIKRKR